MSKYYPSIGEWVQGYGGRMNHLVSGYGKEDSVTHLSKILFTCGKSSDFVPYGRNYSIKLCPKCEAIYNKTKQGI